MSSTQGRNESFASLFEQSAGAKGGQRRYHVGEQVEVTIVAIAREAVFAELGGKQEGVFERPELSDPDGKLRVELGSTVAAVVRGIDGSTGQVRLQPTVIRTAGEEIGVARAAGGSADAEGPLLVSGARVKGKVTGVERYGVFVQIAGTAGRSGRGLVPTAETATSRGSDLKKHFSVGQDVEAKILSIDEEGKIRLSIAALSSDDERGLYEAYRSEKAQGDGVPSGAGEGEAKPAQKGGAAREKAKKPEPRGFGTLGDLLPKIAPKAEAPKVEAKKAEAPRAKAPGDGKRSMAKTKR